MDWCLLALSDPDQERKSAPARLSRARPGTLRFPWQSRDALAQRAVREDLRVRDLERMATEQGGRRRSSAPVPAAAARATEFEEAEERLRQRFAAKVAIVPAPRGGRIEIRYADAGDLTRIVDLLLETNE